MSTGRKSEKLPKQAENAKRGAAGSAKTTAGRSRVFKDRSKYERSEGKTVDSEEIQYETRKAQILNEVPEIFRQPLANFCYREYHGSGYGDVLFYLRELVDILKEPINATALKNRNDGYNEGWIDAREAYDTGCYGEINPG